MAQANANINKQEISKDGNVVRVAHEVQEGMTLAEAGGCLDKDKTSCQKNIDDSHHHDNFIAFDDFTPDSLGQLPDAWEDFREDIFDYVKINMSFVVRVHNHYVSPHRPDNDLFSNKRGMKLDTVASGWVSHIILNGGRCVLGVNTARHVLFDQEEATHSEVVLFNHQDNDEGSVTISGGEFQRGNTEEDWSFLYFETCDKTIVERLTKNDRHSVVSTHNIVNKLAKQRHILGPSFLIGHPHGRKLYVSVGKMYGVNGELVENNVVKYDNKSCVGCSGGLVLQVGRGHDTILKVCHVHSGVDSNDRLGKSSSRLLLGH